MNDTALSPCGPADGVPLFFSSPSAVPALTDTGLALLCEPDRLPAKIEERTTLANLFYGAIRRLPLATAILLADTRRRFYPERSDSKAFFEWIDAALERDLNRTYVQHLRAVGDLLLDTVDTGAGSGVHTTNTPPIHATLCSLSYDKLHALTVLPRPTLINKFWPKYGAAVEDATRDEVREMVAEFRTDATPAPRAPRQLEFSDWLSGMASIPVDRLAKMADVVRPDQALACLRNAATITDLVVESGRMSPEDIVDAMAVLKDGLLRLVPLAEQAGIEIK